MPVNCMLLRMKIVSENMSEKILRFLVGKNILLRTYFKDVKDFYYMDNQTKSNLDKNSNSLTSFVVFKVLLCISWNKYFYFSQYIAS